MSYGRRGFTIIELLVSISIISLLAAILLPSLSESQARARFARWLQFNNQCSTDPSCVINLNFQEGEGEVLKNSALGHDAEGFKASEYNGIIQGDYEWGQGRWVKSKRAIQFDGASTFIEFTHGQCVDFAAENDFTILISIKFDQLSQWDGIFGKCYMRNEVNGYPQYALYYRNASKKKNSTDWFELDIGQSRITFDGISEDGTELDPIENSGWYQIITRNKVVDGEQVVDIFVNGVKLQSTSKKLGTGNKERETANLALGCIRWLLLENRNGEKAPSPYGKPDNFLKGKIDEFIVYNRALTDNEISGHYAMG
ncbi:MAG: prepilin-type N-terminal cleavage/methylation domain-containing protein, partial [Victivallales bacterium]|nr:prepilin-type N-terminal cleavage/methylation domain-containing protein [Victivallales bacterium]